MNLPQLTLSRYSGQLGLFALLFTLNGVHDLIPLLENNVKYFQSVVPVRLLIFYFDKYLVPLGVKLLRSQ